MTDKHDIMTVPPSDEDHVLHFISGVPIRYSKHLDWVFGSEDEGHKPVQLTCNDLWAIQSAIINLEILQHTFFERIAVTETEVAALKALRAKETDSE